MSEIGADRVLAYGSLVAHASALAHASLALLTCAAVAAYAVAWTQRRRPLAQLAAWSGAGVMLLVALAPPVERAAERSFAWHMVQHLLLVSVVAPLIVVARPLRLAAETWLERRRRRWHGARRPGRLPGFGGLRGLRGLRDLASLGGDRWVIAQTLLAVVLLVVVHARPLYDAALDRWFVHDLQHVAFVLAGTLLWSAALGGVARRGPARLAAALGAATGLTIVSLWILSMDEPLSERYRRRLGTAQALDDQRLGAAVMWVGMIAITLPLIVVAVWRWAAAEQRMTERAEALADRTT